MFSFNRYYSYCYNHCNCYNQSRVIQRTLSLNFDVPVTEVQFGTQTQSYIPLCSFGCMIKLQQLQIGNLDTQVLRFGDIINRNGISKFPSDVAFLKR